MKYCSISIGESCYLVVNDMSLLYCLGQRKAAERGIDMERNRSFVFWSVEGLCSFDRSPLPLGKHFLFPTPRMRKVFRPSDWQMEQSQLGQPIHKEAS